jgi:glucokinase
MAQTRAATKRTASAPTKATAAKAGARTRAAVRPKATPAWHRAPATVTAGVDLGGTKIQVVVVNAKRVVGSARVATPQGGVDEVTATIVSTIRAALASAGEAASRLRAIGIGTPGAVHDDGGVSNSPNVPGFEGADPVPLGAMASKTFGEVPVTMDNDVRVAIVGEYHRGAGRPYRDVLGVFVGTGVGGGLILEGKLRHGRGAAGEIGHTVVKDGGRLCGCGKRGHLESYAGRKSIEATARRRAATGAKTDLFDIMRARGRDRVTSGVIARALAKGDRVTVALIDDAVWALGIALANVQNLLDLEAIIVGGGLGDRLGKPFVDRVTEAVLSRLHVPESPPTILPTELGDLSGAVGAAVLAGG